MSGNQRDWHRVLSRVGDRRCKNGGLDFFFFFFSASDFVSGSIFFSFFPLRSFSVFLVRSFFSFYSFSFFLFLLSLSFSSVFKVREEVHIAHCKMIGVLNINTAVSQMTSVEVNLKFPMGRLLFGIIRKKTKRTKTRKAQN